MLKLFLEATWFVFLINAMGTGCTDEAKFNGQEMDTDIVEVKFYYFVQEEIEFTTETISMANISDDTIKFMNKYSGIQIDKVWYEGSRICVDLNESERAKLDAGSFAGIMITSILIKTFSSYPDVKEIEFLIGGERGSFGNHFNFEEVFKLNDR